MAGAAALSFLNPHRGDLVAVLGEATPQLPLRRLADRMREGHGDGPDILRERPRVTDALLERARAMPAGSFGRAYADFMDSHGYKPSERVPARFVEDEELAYVVTRYREVHDFWHVLTGLPTCVLGEVAQKWFEMLQTGLPVAVISSLVGPARLPPSEAAFLVSSLVPWAVRCNASCPFLLGVYLERHLERDLDDVRAELGISLPPRIERPL